MGSACVSTIQAILPYRSLDFGSIFGSHFLLFILLNFSGISYLLCGMGQEIGQPARCSASKRLWFQSQESLLIGFFRKWSHTLHGHEYIYIYIDINQRVCIYLDIHLYAFFLGNIIRQKTYPSKQEILIVGIDKNKQTIISAISKKQKTMKIDQEMINYICSLT